MSFIHRLDLDSSTTDRRPRTGTSEDSGSVNQWKCQVCLCSCRVRLTHLLRGYLCHMGPFSGRGGGPTTLVEVRTCRSARVNMEKESFRSTTRLPTRSPLFRDHSWNRPSARPSGVHPTPGRRRNRGPCPRVRGDAVGRGPTVAPTFNAKSRRSVRDGCWRRWSDNLTPQDRTGPPGPHHPLRSRLTPPPEGTPRPRP